MLLHYLVKSYGIRGESLCVILHKLAIIVALNDEKEISKLVSSLQQRSSTLLVDRYKTSIQYL